MWSFFLNQLHIDTYGFLNYTSSWLLKWKKQLDSCIKSFCETSKWLLPMLIRNKNLFAWIKIWQTTYGKCNFPFRKKQILLMHFCLISHIKFEIRICFFFLSLSVDTKSKLIENKYQNKKFQFKRDIFIVFNMYYDSPHGFQYLDLRLTVF